MRNKLIITIFFLGFSLIGNSQEKIEFKNSTPKETVESHLNFLKQGNYNPNIAVYTLGDVKYSQAHKKALIIKLKDILLKLKINTENLLDKRGTIFSKKKYVLSSKIPEIYLIKKNKVWAYSPETVSKIDSIYNTLFIPAKLRAENTNKEIEEFVSEVTDIIDTLKPELNLSTPYNTIMSHLMFLSDSLFNPEIAAKTINFGEKDTANAADLAIKLNQIYLGSPVQVFDFTTLSKDSNYIDTITHKHIYIPNPKFKELYLVKIGDKWLYSRATSKLIYSVHKRIYSDAADDIFSFSDKFKAYAGNGKSKYIPNLQLWQEYMMIFFISIWIFLLTLNFIVKLVIKKYFKQNSILKITVKLFSYSIFILFFIVIQEYVPSVRLNIDITQIIHKVFSIIVIIYATLISINIVNLIKFISTRRDEVNSKVGMFVFISLILKTIIIIIGFLFILKTLEYNLMNVLAGLSIGGFALALGAQDTIKNFFGSIMIFTDRPFSVGDYIVNNEIRGTVEEVGLRTTKIRTPLNSVATIPNGRLADNNIDNLGRRKFRRYKSKLSVAYDTPIEKLDELILKATEKINKIDSTKDDVTRIYMNDFGVYGIEIFISISFNVDTRKEELESRHKAIKEILKLCADLGIKIAVGIQSQTTK